MKLVKNLDLHKERKSIKEGIIEGKIKTSIFLIFVDLTSNSLFKIIIATMYSIMYICIYIYIHLCMLIYK